MRGPLSETAGDSGANRASELLRLYVTMLRIRVFEEQIAECIEAGEIGTPCHLYIGQEAIAAGVCAAPSGRTTSWTASWTSRWYRVKPSRWKTPS